jgi:hypothetical protein
LEPALAKVAVIARDRSERRIVFDAEFKVFASDAASYELAGLRPWTVRTGLNGGRADQRPDARVDDLGQLCSTLARASDADLAVLRRSNLDESYMEGAAYLLFVTHPMREAQAEPEVPYLTFYAFDAHHSVLREGRAANAVEVNNVIAAVEKGALRGATPLQAAERERYRKAGVSLSTWLKERLRMAGGGLFAARDYFVPIPVALIAVE